MTLKKYIARKTYKLRKGYPHPSSRHNETESTRGTGSKESESKESESKEDRKHSDSLEGRKVAGAKHGIKRGKSLFTPIFDNTKNIQKGDKLLLTMGKNENTRIPFFLKYYQALGVDHFLFIDNDSDNPMAEVIPNEPHLSLWTTSDSYVKSNFGVDWMNYFNHQYGDGHWVLTVDLDEFFVFPNMEERSFTELTSFLDTMEQKSMFAPLVDMYPKGPISQATVPVGESPLDYANLFDSSGFKAEKGDFHDVWLRGGPRCRVFNEGDIEKSPTLNKTPLIKWDKNTYYFSSTHTAYPPKLNEVYPSSLHTPTGALLHFKFLSEAREKARYAVKHKNHYEGSREYYEYLKKLEENEELDLSAPCSKTYTSSHSLVEASLMTSGIWGL